MIKWALWWRCWCFSSAFQRPLCLCSSAERVCWAERELDRAWCEYELHAGGLKMKSGCRVQQTQAVSDKALVLKTNQCMGSPSVASTAAVDQRLILSTKFSVGRGEV